MVQVIREGKRVELASMAELNTGDNVIVSGLDINRVQFVRQWEIEQNRKNPETGNFEDVQVPQFHFNLNGRSFTITGEGLLSDGEALLATVKKTAKGNDRVKELYLVANSWHPTLKDGEGNDIEENGNPVLNMEVTNNSFTYSGMASAGQVAEEQDDNLAYEAKKNKIAVVDGATVDAIITSYLAKAGQAA